MWHEVQGGVSLPGLQCTQLQSVWMALAAQLLHWLLAEPIAHHLHSVCPSDGEQEQWAAASVAHFESTPLAALRSLG